MLCMIMSKLVWRRTLEGNGSGDIDKSLFFPWIRPLAGGGTICPREGGSQNAPLAESGIGGNVFAGVNGGWLWGRRSTAVVPRGVEWREVEPVPTRAYWNRNTFTDQFTHHHHHYRAP